ncbi:thermonuclease family protein [Aureisphaera sp. CAU 1614]|uniref:Thermonuclease family protein n=1 Tax=Halomarinibacterium sedimenti TaxID=2857106 RepID=A0A9X1FN35_9FLAO|nr:thermonuclease family protein [Halomarinibacterium sedimenti]MBW2937539.1 thermonuclease family protein [Halomarinibacterium sedimenti]
MINRLLFIFIIVSLIGISCNSKSGNRKVQIKEFKQIDKEGFLKVTKVVDGDTFWVDDGSDKGIKIRLIGVDAPESRNAFKKKKGYLGKEAKSYLSNLIEGRSVKLEYDVDSLDQYGRTLAYVYLPDGTFVNANLVKNGYAMVMTIPPNVKYSDLFLKLQIIARQNNLGLWKTN